MELAGRLTAGLPGGGTAGFAHGGGSGRHRIRNRYSASVLRACGLGMLLFDLLTREEEGLERAAGLARDWFADHLLRRQAHV